MLRRTFLAVAAIGLLTMPAILAVPDHAFAQGPAPKKSFTNPLGKKFQNPVTGVQEVILALINFMLNITVALALGGIVWGGLLIIFGFAKEENVKKGKTIIAWSIIGLIIIIMAQIILRFIGTLLGVVEGT